MAGRLKGTPKTGGRPKGGRNKIGADIREAAAKHTVAAIAEIVRIMTHSENDTARLAAANAILDRAYGKPAQAIIGDATQPVTLVLKWANDCGGP